MVRRSTRVLLGLAGLAGLACLGVPASALPAVSPAAFPAASPVASPAAKPAQTPDDVEVRLTSFSPVAPKPGDTVTITGTATNKTDAVLTRPQAIACNEPDRIADRAGIAALSGDGDGCKGLAGSESTAFHDFADAIDPGATKQFTISVPWEQWQFSRASGVYVVGVRIFADDTSGSRATRAIARTLMPVVAPGEKLRTVKTAMVITLRHKPTQLVGTYFSDESLLDDMDPEQGRLSRLLSDGAGRSVTWVIDPSLLDEARRLAEGYRTDGALGVRPEPSPVARDWLSRLDQAVGNDPVVMLPYADPDVRGLVDAGLGRLVAEAREIGAASAAPGGKQARTGFWLDPDAANESTLATASGSTAADVTLLSNTSWNADERPESPLVRINTSAGPVRAVVADQALMSGGPDGSNGPVQLRQRLAAETALLALDTGGSSAPPPVSVAVVPGRTFDTLGTATGTVMQALKLPWVDPIGIDKLDTGTVPTVPAPAPERTDPLLTPPQLDSIRTIDGDITTYTSLLTTGTGRAGWDHSKLRAASLTWRGAEADGDKFRRYQAGYLHARFDKVRIVNSDAPSDDIVTLSASKGRFPLTVANDLNVPVRVGLRIESLNRDDLAVEPIETARIRGGNRETFEVRASAQQNGLIRARVHLVTEDGRELGRPLELDIRAAQYGTVGWVLVGAAVALLFGTSAIRIYRRIRSERRAAAKAERDASVTATPDLASPIPSPATPTGPGAGAASAGPGAGAGPGSGTSIPGAGASSTGPGSGSASGGSGSTVISAADQTGVNGRKAPTERGLPVVRTKTTSDG